MSNVRAWSDYPEGWIFRHRELPVAAEDLIAIMPLTPVASRQYWIQHVSREASHASHFMNDDWPAQNGVWAESGDWQGCWDSDSNELPELLAAHLSWDDNTVVYFCYHAGHVIQTSWKIFRRYWKNFLFYDDEPLLLAKKRAQVAQFHPDGSFHIGIRPSASE